MAVALKSVAVTLNLIPSFCALVFCFFGFFFYQERQKKKSLKTEEKEGDAVINVLKHRSCHCPAYAAVIFVFLYCLTKDASFLTRVTLR